MFHQGTSPSQRGICNICRQEFNCLYKSPEGGQLKNQQPSKAPPTPQRKSARFLSITEQRNVTGTFLKDIRSFHDFQKHPHKKHMDINVVLFLSYACGI